MHRTIGQKLLLSACLLWSVQAGFAQVPMSPTPAFSTHSLEDRNGSVLIGNPLLDEGGTDRLGWFGTTDVGLVNANVNNGLRNFVTVGGNTKQVSLPSASLDWTVSPRFELGYRCGQAAGEFLISYRFVLTSGTDALTNGDPVGNTGTLRSRLNMHIIDLDYASQENSLRPWFDMKWRAGVRMSSLFFDSQETAPLGEQRVTNTFFGAGPHFALDLWRPLATPRLVMFCKLDMAGVLGRVDQTFEETLITPAGAVSGFTPASQFVPTISLMVQAGLAWTPRDNWRISAGYTYEHWWDVGFSGAITQPPTFSRADITTQGIFFRSEWKF